MRAELDALHRRLNSDDRAPLAATALLEAQLASPDRQARGRAGQGPFLLAAVVSLHLVQAKWTPRELEELKTMSLLLLVNLAAVCVVHDAVISSRRTHV